MTTALSLQNRESELSYAYIHAVAAHAGMDCQVSTRHGDNAGIDAKLTAWGPFDHGGFLTEVQLSIQLKATIASPSETDEHLSFFMKGVKQYDDLRHADYMVPRVLVVLFLPPSADEWIEHTTDSLVLRKCAYWTSLCGAPPTDNQSGVTVKLPKANVFNSESLSSIMTQLSRRESLTYAGTDDGETAAS